MEGAFRRRLCSHCFAASCLRDAGNALLVVSAAMFNVARGVVSEDIRHWLMYCDNGDADGAKGLGECDTCKEWSVFSCCCQVLLADCCCSLVVTLGVRVRSL
jgi:hypothetical protein